MKKILVFLITIFIFTFPVAAKEISIKKNIPYNKVWTVKFTHDLDWRSIKNGITIVDSNGRKQSIRATLGDKPNTLVVLPPQNGYKPLETYTMIINNNIKTKKGTNLKDNTTFKFKISGQTPVKPKEYDIKFAKVVVKAYYNGKIISDKYGIVVDNKVITTYSAIDGADSAVITTNYGVECDVYGVYWYDKNKNIAVLKINPTNILSADVDKINKIEIGNISMNQYELEDLLSKYEYKELIRVRKENHYSMSLDELENYMWKKYSNYKIDNFSVVFDNVLVLNNEKNSNVINMYFVMNEKNFTKFWNFAKMGSYFRKKIENMLGYAYNDAINQFPKKMINLSIVCNYTSKENIANFKGDNAIYNDNLKIWDIREDIVYFTKIQGDEYSKWNENF